MHHRRWMVMREDGPSCIRPHCDKNAVSRGLCQNHYGQFRRNSPDRAQCTVGGCGGSVEARGLCYRHYATARRYGIAPAEYVALRESQSGMCPVCSVDVGGDALVVDHDHETGEVRGLICAACNFMLGQAQDSPDTLLAAAAYLMQHQNVLMLA
jgi:hypothetical protein